MSRPDWSQRLKDALRADKVVIPGPRGRNESEFDNSMFEDRSHTRGDWVAWERRVRILAASYVFAAFFINLLISHWQSEGVSEQMPLLDLLGAGPLPPLNTAAAAVLSLVFTALGYAAYVALRDLRPAGRLLATPIWLVSLLLIPQGTFVGVLVLLQVWHDRTSFILSERYYGLMAQEPDVQSPSTPVLNRAVLLSVPLNLLAAGGLWVEWLAGG